MKKVFILLGFLLVCSFVKAQTSIIKDYGIGIEFCHQSGDTTGFIKTNLVGGIKVVRNGVKINDNKEMFYVRAADYGYDNVDSLRNYLYPLILGNYRVNIANDVSGDSDTLWYSINANGVVDTTCYQLKSGETFFGAYIPY